MSERALSAIESATKCDTVFVKFLSPNDTGLTGGHQCGIYIPKPSVSLIFDKQFERGKNQERFADIIWNDSITTHSRFVYYGQGTRDEYRITRFGRGFDLLKPDHTGDLVIICRENAAKYRAYTLSDDDSIQTFLDAFSLSPTETNALIKDRNAHAETEEALIETYLMKFEGDFPSTHIMALSAEEIDRVLNGEDVTLSPDEAIIRWIDTEYRLFRRIEEYHYAYVTLEPAKSLDDFVKTGLEITNRRKSRAGKSLEHHLEVIFNECGILYKAQATTEVNKKPDFIFPSQEAYNDPSFPNEFLTFLGAKTTCKDRWRQIINEAARIETKYLFTLQQGISPNQLKEMEQEHVVLVVPKRYHRFYPTTECANIISLVDFINMVLGKQRGVYGV